MKFLSSFKPFKEYSGCLGFENITVFQVIKHGCRYRNFNAISY
jgi:hypothetical protein